MNLPLANALTVRGIQIKPWHRNVTNHVFTHGVFDGLLKLGESELMIIAFISEGRGSGQLGELLSRFEEACDEQQVAIRVVHFWNDRLYHWFRKRGYLMSTHPEFGRNALRLPKAAEPSFVDRKEVEIERWTENG